jgi:tagatose 1,6-diphosphate aldolase
MPFALGSRRGLAASALSNGTFAMLALDHRQNYRKEMSPDDPASVSYDDMVDLKRAMVRALSPVVSGVLLDPEIGAAQCITDGSLPGSVGLVVAIEATGYSGEPEARLSRVLDGWSVEKVKRMGASAAKLLLYYHPDSSTADHQERLLADVATSCRNVDLPLFVEPLSFSTRDRRPLSGDERRRVVVETARRLTTIGGDVLKAEFPYDKAVIDQDRWRDACAELNAASSLPWVLLSGGVDHDTFAKQVAVACEAGASGVLAGRSVWAEAATLASPERDRFLTTTARERMRGLTEIVTGLGHPWHDRPSRIASADMPSDGWYRRY